MRGFKKILSIPSEKGASPNGILITVGGRYFKTLHFSPYAQAPFFFYICPNHRILFLFAVYHRPHSHQLDLPPFTLMLMDRQTDDNITCSTANGQTIPPPAHINSQINANKQTNEQRYHLQYCGQTEDTICSTTTPAKPPSSAAGRHFLFPISYCFKE